MPAFHIRVDGGKEQVFETRSGIYMHAAMAVPAMLDSREIGTEMLVVNAAKSVANS